VRESRLRSHRRVCLRPGGSLVQHDGCLPSPTVLEQIVGSDPVIRMPSVAFELFGSIQRTVELGAGASPASRQKLLTAPDRDLAAVSHSTRPEHAVTGVSTPPCQRVNLPRAADSTGCIPDLTRTLSTGCQIVSWRVPDRATNTLMKG
jgi:hypothetical protein